MHPAIAVGDAVLGIIGHPGRSHVVVAADWMIADQIVKYPLARRIPKPLGRLDFAQARILRLSREDFHQRSRAFNVLVAQAPVELDARHAHSVNRLVESHPAVGIGRLLRTDHDCQFRPAAEALPPGAHRARELLELTSDAAAQFPQPAPGPRWRRLMLSVQIGPFHQGTPAADGASGRDGHGAVEDAEILLRSWRRSEQTGIFHSSQTALGERTEHSPDRCPGYRAAAAMRMLHKETPDQVVLVSNARFHHAVGRQQ